MKPSELRDMSDEELVEKESELREQIIKLRVARASSRRVSTAQFTSIRRDIARIKTLQTERKLEIKRD